MQPTPLARRLAEPITVALSSITNAVNYKEQFDPKTSKRQFSIAVTELGEIDLIPHLANKCSSVAPRIQISTVRAGAIDLTREMEAGRVDLALGAFEDVSTSLYRRRLFKQSYVTMFRAGHALGQGDITLKNFLSAHHLFVSTSASPYDRVNRYLQRAGIMATVTLRVPQFTAVPYLLRSTDCVATVPERFAEAAAAPFGLEFISPPLRLPSLRINCLWHPRFHQDEGNQWLLGLIVELFSK